MMRENVMGDEKLRALIVDDDRAVRSELREMLERYHDVAADEAVDGPHGLAKMSEFRYDLLFLDMVMPRMDGAVVLWHLSGAGYYRPRYIIAMSSVECGDVFKRAAYEGGAHESIYKPVTSDDVLWAVDILRLQAHAEELLDPARA
jgi:CheY-like chemotaxis protein